MGIGSNHPLYDEFLPVWERCADTVAGERSVKSKGAAYLPVIAEGQSEVNRQYREGASYYNAAGSTIEAMTGIMFSQIPVMDKATKLPINNIDGNFMSLPAFHKKMVAQDATFGRLGLWVNFDESRGVPYVRMFDARQCVNWLYDVNKGYTNILIEEIVYISDPSDPYELSAVTFRRELLLEDGIYKQNWYRRADTKEGKEQWVKEGETVVPTYTGGRAITKIPFIFVTPEDISAEIYDPPIENISELDLKYYRNSANVEWLCHFACLPTPYGTGIKEDGKPVLIGPTNFLKFEDKDAKLGILSFDGKSAEVILKMMEQKERQMAQKGVKIFETKGGVESGEAKKLRLGAATSELQTIGDTTTLAMQWMLNIMAEWMNQSVIAYNPNRDYLPDDISPEKIRALLETYLKGTMSLETLVKNFSKGNLLGEGDTVEGEVDKLTNREPVSLGESIGTE